MGIAELFTLLGTPLFILILLFLTVTWLMWLVLPFIIYYKLERIAKATERTAAVTETQRVAGAVSDTVKPVAAAKPASLSPVVSQKKPVLPAKRWRVAKEGSEIGEMDLEQIRKALWAETLSSRDTYYDTWRGEWLSLNALLASMVAPK
ncbi:MAG: hypothetical protein LBO05_04185 [Deltaproteobacteria bacterium]|jgi:hypothetical protein|nr:hypothetical protein [Deltaproteobacteria bacterium]